MTLTAATWVHAPYDAVWHALARADGYAGWGSAPCLEFGARPGDPVVFGTPERVVYMGEIVRIERGRGLAHTFRFVGFGFEEPASRVEIAVVEQGAVVHVAVDHDCAGAPRTREIIGPLGWAKSLARLKTLLETGRPMPWPSE